MFSLSSSFSSSSSSSSSFSSVDQLIRSNSVTDRGINFLMDNPSEYLSLIKKNIVLARRYADTMSSVQIQAMLTLSYSKKDKFFTDILNTRTLSIEFNDYLDNAEMRQYLLDKGATEWEIRRISLLDGTITPDSFRNATGDTHILNALIKLIDVLISKVKKPFKLDPEFKNHGIFGGEHEDRLLSELINYKGPAIDRIFSNILRLTSPTLALKLLARRESKTLYEKLLSQRSVFRNSVESSFDLWCEISKQGAQAFKSCLDFYEIDLLDRICRSNPNLAVSFYELAGIFEGTNILDEKYPASSKAVRSALKGKNRGAASSSASVMQSEQPPEYLPPVVSPSAPPAVNLPARLTHVYNAFSGLNIQESDCSPQIRQAMEKASELEQVLLEKDDIIEHLLAQIAELQEQVSPSTEKKSLKN